MKKMAMVLFSASLSVGALASGHEPAHHHDGVSASACAIAKVLPGQNSTMAVATLKNHGKHARKVTAVRIAGVEGKVSLHKMSMKDHVMTMEPLKALILKSGKNYLQGGGNHVMIEDLTTELPLGSSHTLTFTLGNGKTVSCAAVVKSVEEIKKHHHAAQGVVHKAMHHAQAAAHKVAHEAHKGVHKAKEMAHKAGHAVQETAHKAMEAAKAVVAPVVPQNAAPAAPKAPAANQ